MLSVSRRRPGARTAGIIRAGFMTPDSHPPQEAIKRRIAELALEHRGLDAMIDKMVHDGGFDELQLRRLKKRKLQLKDAMIVLQMQLVPDIQA
jgi:hypothetical protein